MVRAIARGVIIGRPEAMREADVIAFCWLIHLLGKRLPKWRMERHPEADQREAEAALRAMNPRELHNATLLMDNEEARPMGNRHQVAYNPHAELWKLR